MMDVRCTDGRGEGEGKMVFCYLAKEAKGRWWMRRDCGCKKGVLRKCTTGGIEL
jgi:hypothetical protein